MASFTPLSLITFFGGAQGILVAAAIARSQGPNKPANRLLALLISLISFVLLGSLMNVNDRALVKRIPDLIFFLDIPLLAFGPLIYLYVRRLLTFSSNKDQRWLVHFIPVALHQIHLGRYILESNNETLERLASRDFPLAPYVITFATIQIAFYLIASLRTVSRFRTQVQNERSEQPVIGYLTAFLFAMGACWLAWFVSGLVFIFPSVSLFQSLKPDVAWILMAMTTAMLAYFAMAEKESLAIHIETKKYEGSTLNQEQQHDLAIRLTALMNKEKPFLQSRLTLSTLAVRLKVSSKDLSRVINEHYGKNFFDYINSYRIAEFKRLATNKKLANETILAIALDAGFNSKSTFNHSFKKLTGKTPAQFLKNTPSRKDPTSAMQSLS